MVTAENGLTNIGTTVKINTIMRNCGLCHKQLSFWNQPLFTKHDLTSGESICTSCFLKVNNKSPKMAFNIKKHSLDDIKSLLNLTPKNIIETQREVQFDVIFSQNTQTEEEKREYTEATKKYPKWYGNANTRGICFENERIEPLKNGQTEIVRYKTDRYADLFGRGKDCSYFPGYGKIYNRTFEIWFRNVGSKEKHGLVDYKDIGNDQYEGPFFSERITNGIHINNKLEKTLGYLKLFNARDDKNNKTWYAGLKDIEFTGIITDNIVEGE